ncbi:hypothetical protein N7453_000474 [Penicillium expansum]|nr:hypothetical protein N7453_000474 [Penicillium expansum]
MLAWAVYQNVATLVENIREPLNTAIFRYSVQYLADSKEELQIQGKVYRLEFYFYSLSFRYSQSQESNDHHYTSVEKRLLEKEVLLRPSETRVTFTEPSEQVWFEICASAVGEERNVYRVWEDMAI